MRKITFIFILAVLVSGTSALAQKAEKPSMGKISAVVEKSKVETVSLEDLLEAKKNSDISIEYDKTKDKTRTWYMRGFIYNLIYEYEQDVDGVSKDDAIRISSEALNKTMELGKETDFNVVLAGQQIQAMWGNLLNDGVNEYNAGNSSAAAKLFEYTASLKPADTTAYQYAASAAREAGEYEKSVKNYNEVLRIVPDHEIAHAEIIRIQRDLMKDYDAAGASIERAKAALGDKNPTVNKLEIDYLILTDNVEKALQRTENAIAADPANYNLQLKKGLLYDQLAANLSKKDDVANAEKINEYLNKAEEAYKSAIEIRQDDITAFFNLAVIINNRANVYFKEVNMMNPEQYRTKGKKLQEDGLALMKTAIPYMEKARELSPDDQDVLFALQTFYSRLDDKEKLDEVNAQLKKLGLQ